MYNGSSKFALDRTDSERLFRQLVIHGVLDEELYVTCQDHTVCYIRLGTRANELLSGKFKVLSRIMLQYLIESFTAALLCFFFMSCTCHCTANTTCSYNYAHASFSRCALD